MYFIYFNNYPFKEKQQQQLTEHLYKSLVPVMNLCHRMIKLYQIHNNNQRNWWWAIQQGKFPVGYLYRNSRTITYFYIFPFHYYIHFPTVKNKNKCLRSMPMISSFDLDTSLGLAIALDIVKNWAINSCSISEEIIITIGLMTKITIIVILMYIIKLMRKTCINVIKTNYINHWIDKCRQCRNKNKKINHIS